MVSIKIKPHHGALSDHLGRLRVVSIGWTTRVLLLLAFAWLPDNGITVWALFLGYAAAMAFTEGAERALIGDFAPPEQKPLCSASIIC